MNADLDLNRLAGGAHHDPHSILGAHPGPGGVTIRALRPLAEKVQVLVDGDVHDMEHLDFGVFEVTVPGLDKVPDYRLRVSYAGAEPYEAADPYRFWPTLGEVDLHLIGEGRHERLWEVLGARLMRHQDVDGTAFAVWAPNARGVRVIGDFNHWNGSGHPMRSLGGSGVWELFVPGVGEGARYKFAVLGADSVWREKADPMARRTEVPPATASVVDRSEYGWQDDEWMRARPDRRALEEPMSVYEVHLASWRPGLSYLQLADELVDYVRDMGFTHVELLPVAEHPFGGSWGYQVTSYYAPTSRFGSPDEFRHLVDRLHRAGIGVILDWVPAHFPKDAWALARFDGTPLYEHSDPARGEHPEWGTYIFDFGRKEVRNFLVANALYWLKEFHIDGLRVDAVASMLYLDYSRREGEWTPNQYGGRENLDAVEFLKEMNAVCYREAPGIVTIAEESTAWPGVSRPAYLGGLGFGFKWNMGWMHDTLAYLAHEPVFRQYHHHQMTFSLMYAYSENFVLPLSHDEVVHGKGSLLGKMPGDEWQRFANLRALLAFMWAHPGKQLLFMGGEFGQGAEWSEERGLDWWMLQFDGHKGVQQLVRDLNRVYRETPAMWRLDTSPEGFRWIDADDAPGNVFSFLRQAPDGSAVACVANFSGAPHEDYHLGLPAAGTWTEVVNTDAYAYAGSGIGNLGAVEAVEEPRHGLPYSARLRVPPLGALWLRRAASEEAPETAGEDVEVAPSGEIA
ncbi:1,4-alpha-glucan branching protein GlgB [Planomonospora sp. ID91781]|uniref:1,4-alpha-glucan branching enzyme GlgB n=1 Tax=Planomonospora sphaerica TaxID=161355 RepID=A0A161LNU5_9ACTN|nr:MULTISPECIES: 1,4-alpha-glucan branching protein GlgB [Planomonospora]MBG0825437.1 1,4-alpha-glucan branching protein GlgB [Planomonospora sp. ID91781]GAT67636.1 glycogen branching protein [Planomonospora sphaerica]